MKFPCNTTYFLEQETDFKTWQNQLFDLKGRFAKEEAIRYLLFCQDSYQFCLCFFALIAAGKQLVLPPSGQVIQIEQCMVHADVLVTDLTEHFNAKRSVVDQVVLHEVIKTYSNQTPSEFAHSTITQLDKFDLSNSKQEELSFQKESEVVFFTSGSSGTPKAIIKTFEQLIKETLVLDETFSKAYVTQTKYAEQAEQKRLFMSTVSHQHIYGLLFKMLWPIWSGSNVYLNVFSYPEHLAQKITTLQTNEHKAQNVFLVSSPAYFNRLVEDNVLVDIKDNLSMLFSSGGPLHEDVAIKLKNCLDVAPTEVFGSTETGGIAWRQRKLAADDTWQVFNGIEITADKDTQRLSILSSYLSNTQWFETDDKVKLLSQQNFKLLGRIDRVVKIEEKRCSLDQITLQLNEHHWVKSAYVLVLHNKNKRRSLAAVVILTTKGKLAIQDSGKLKINNILREHLKQYMEAIVVPKKFRYIDCFPYNNQDKLSLNDMERLFD
jgi:acyl-coenzyme A synthetase/AMP-(fatty) acid ligase